MERMIMKGFTIGLKFPEGGGGLYEGRYVKNDYERVYNRNKVPGGRRGALRGKICKEGL